MSTNIQSKICGDITRKQHTTPVCYFKPFLKNKKTKKGKISNGKNLLGLYIYDKKYKTHTFKPPTAKCFYSYSYYEHDSISTNFIEKEVLKKIEDEWSSIIIPKLKDYKYITENDKKVISKFIRIQMYRTKTCEKELYNLRKGLELLNFNENTEKTVAYVKNRLISDSKMVQLDLLQDTEVDNRLIHDYHWNIFYNSNPMHKFILSDCPLITQKLINNECAIDFSIINYIDSYFIPITPDRVITLIRKGKNFKYRVENCIIKKNDNYLYYMNNFQIINANRYIYYYNPFQLKIIINTLNRFESYGDCGHIGRLWDIKYSDDYTINI
jgi:hypothetical protein